MIQITGPLIRIVGDRFPWGVKAAILQTLCLLITKGAILLKPFVPQLQTTFVKALSDTTRIVRMRLGAVQARLPLHTSRAAGDGASTPCSADAAVQYALLCALAGVLRGIAKPLSDETFQRIKTSALEYLFGEDDELSIAAA